MGSSQGTHEWAWPFDPSSSWLLPAVPSCVPRSSLPWPPSSPSLSDSWAQPHPVPLPVTGWVLGRAALPLTPTLPVTPGCLAHRDRAAGAGGGGRQGASALFRGSPEAHSEGAGRFGSEGTGSLGLGHSFLPQTLHQAFGAPPGGKWAHKPGDSSEHSSRRRRWGRQVSWGDVTWGGGSPASTGGGSEA